MNILLLWSMSTTSLLVMCPIVTSNKFTTDDPLVYHLPPLDEVWLSEPEHCDCGCVLAKHVYGEPVSGDFNYNIVFGMLLYLAGHTCPDITYAVNCALVHKHILKQIGCHLNSDKGLIMKPSEKLLKVDSFPYANFSGIYGH
ncbi:hypothetical protein ACHAXS_000120 [Conticribra weissflogii]